MDTLIDDITGDIFNPWENSAYAQSLLEMWKRVADSAVAKFWPTRASRSAFCTTQSGQPRHLDAVSGGSLKQEEEGDSERKMPPIGGN